MSKIYKALEKAERERKIKKESSSISVIGEIRPERQELMPEIKKMDGKGYSPRLVTLSEPGSLAAEQFRKLRTYIHKLNISTPLRTIMVTSATNGEGKSFVAANLGIAMARDLHKRALLVDCDFRNPTLTQLFGLQSGEGLSDYLKGDKGLLEHLKETGVEKLNVIAAGSVQDNPTELLGSNKMKAFVEELNSQDNNQFAIFDSTPLLATSEPEVLSKLVDGIILVVRAGVTPRETVQRAIMSLEKEKIIGVVLNDLTFKSGGLFSRYFGSDGYYYKYGYRKRKPRVEGRWKKLFRFARRRKGIE
jgi:protein-tyrosine kinase